MNETNEEVIEELRRERRRHRRVWMGLASVAVLAWAVPVFSQTMVPYVFSPNTPARASEINANFSALAGEIDANRDRIAAIEGRDDFVPTGTIAFFATAGCPTGWSEYNPANGRYVVAMTGMRAVEGVVGDAMTNQQNLAHTHTMAHRHVWARSNAAARDWHSYTSDAPGSGMVELHDWGNGVGDGNGRWPLEHERTNTLYTGDPTESASGEARTGDIAPYIQLRACRKDAP